MSKYHTQTINNKPSGATKSFYSNILSRYKGKSKSIIVPGFLVLFLLVFTDKFSEIISAVLVKPLFSTLHQSSIVIDLICIFGGLSIILFFVIKGIRLVRLSVMLELYIYSLTFIYLYFRFFDTSRYDFVPFRSNLVSFLSLADTLLSFIVGVVCYYIFYAIKFVNQYKHQLPVHEGFFTDTPLVLEESSDILGRFGYVKDLANKILATNSPNHSFAIGIIGEWGAGKTTFLSTLENIFEKEQQVVQLRFNPWATRNGENISAIFFSDLAARLSRFDESLKTSIIDYSKKLLQTTDSNSLTVIKQLFEFSTEKKEFHEQYEIINQSIQGLNKRIVVYIDDVDRLDKKEVIEVLRIVRNTANFGSTFFIVAFDKAYVTASVNEGLISRSEKYLEKIFQLEYYLPLQPNKLVYRTELLRNLRNYVPESSQAILNYIENPSSTLFGSFEILPKIADYITTFRDVNRFMNVFLLNYDSIKHNIYLPDYISICLLRLKYPAVYQSLYYTRSKFLTTSTDYHMFDHFVGELFIRLEEKGNNDLGKTELYKHLQIHHEDFAISEDEIRNVVELVNSIFASPNQSGIANGIRTLHNHHLTITQASTFERYFDFSLEGRLDQFEFENALKLPFEALKKKVEEWNTSRSISTDLIVKLENVIIPCNKEFFEKLIKSIVYLTTLPIPQNTDHEHSYNVEDFYEKLGGKCDDKNKVVKEIYKGDKEKFKEFFKTLYFFNSKMGKWGFVHDFAVRLIKDYDDDFIVSHEELKELIKDSFLASLIESSGLTTSILGFYNLAIRLFQKSDINGSVIVPEGKGVEMTEKLKELINSDFLIYLNWNIFRNGPSGGFNIGGWHKVIYGSEEEFNKVVELKKEEAAVKEYIRFRDAYNEAGHPIKFEFELLKPY